MIKSLGYLYFRKNLGLQSQTPEEVFTELLNIWKVANEAVEQIFIFYLN